MKKLLIYILLVFAISAKAQNQQLNGFVYYQNGIQSVLPFGNPYSTLLISPSGAPYFINATRYDYEIDALNQSAPVITTGGTIFTYPTYPVATDGLYELSGLISIISKQGNTIEVDVHYTTINGYAQTIKMITLGNSSNIYLQGDNPLLVLPMSMKGGTQLTFSVRQNTINPIPLVFDTHLSIKIIR